MQLKFKIKLIEFLIQDFSGLEDKKLFLWKIKEIIKFREQGS